MILRSRYLFKILTILSLIITILYTKCYHFKSVFDLNDTEFTGIVEDYVVKDNKISHNKPIHYHIFASIQ